MSIRGKLRFTCGVIGVILISLVVFMIGAFVQNARQIKSAGRAMENLYAVSQIRLNINRQIKYVMDYFLSDTEFTTQRFEESSIKVQTAMDAWLQTPPESRDGGSGNAPGLGAKGEEIRKKHAVAAGMIKKTVDLARSGKRKEASAYMENIAEPWIDSVLLKELDETIAGQVEEVGEAFGKVLVWMGTVPWSSQEGYVLIKKEQMALTRLLAEEKVHSGVSRFMKEVNAYFVSPQRGNKEEVLSLGTEINRALLEWSEASEKHLAMGIADKKPHLLEAQKSAELFREVFSLAAGALDAKSSGQGNDPRRIVKEQINPMVEDVFFPKIAAAIEESKHEIDRLHQELLDFSLRAWLKGIAMLATFSAVILFMALRLTRAMIVSLDKLKMGVENIGAGDLGYRIDLPAKDELGVLAALFNTMAGDLQKSREELVTAKEHAEHNAEGLRQSNEELRTFAFIASHDLRTPLVTLQGFSGELRSTVSSVSSVLEACLPHLDDAERESLNASLHTDIPQALGFIESSAVRMETLIKSIRKLTHLGHRDLKLESVDTDELMHTIIRTCVRQLKETGAAVRVDPLPVVVSDRISMEQIVRHLFDNAVKYLDSGRPGEIEVCAERNPQEIIFHVRDNGRGIAKEDTHKIFEIFRRAGSQNVPGEGMGLACAKTLVRRLGGRIWCESEPGVGSTFSFTMPANPLGTPWGQSTHQG